jgi:hypothetical protein
MEMVNGALNSNGRGGREDVLMVWEFVVSEGLDLSNWALLLLVGDYATRQLVLYEKRSTWIAF